MNEMSNATHYQHSSWFFNTHEKRSVQLQVAELQKAREVHRNTWIFSFRDSDWSFMNCWRVTRDTVSHGDNLKFETCRCRSRSYQIGTRQKKVPTQGCPDLLQNGTDWLAPKWNRSETLSDQIWLYFRSSSQDVPVLKSDLKTEKVTDLSHLGPIWPTLERNLTSLYRQETTYVITSARCLM